MLYDNIFGAILIATWINTVLLMLEALQVLKCLRARGNDVPRRLLVLWCFVIDIACSSATCAGVYLYTVTHWGEIPYSMNQHWPMSVQVVCTGTVAFSVQLFLIVRYYLLSRNIFVSGVLLLVSFASLAGAIASSVTISIHSSYTERNFVTAPSLVWLGASAGVDWMIAVMLVWELRRRKVRVGTVVTDGIIRRLISNAIKTGSVTSFLATMGLVAYFAAPETNAPVAFGFILGRVYSLTMLYNINSSAGLTSKSHRRHRPELPEGPDGDVAPGYKHTEGNVAMFTTLTITRHSIDEQQTSGMFSSLNSTTGSRYRDEE